MRMARLLVALQLLALETNFRYVSRQLPLIHVTGS